MEFKNAVLKGGQIKRKVFKRKLKFPRVGLSEHGDNGLYLFSLI